MGKVSKEDAVLIKNTRKDRGGARTRSRGGGFAPKQWLVVSSSRGLYFSMFTVSWWFAERPWI